MIRLRCRVRPWVAQQARELLMDMGRQAGRFQLLIRDRDAKFTAAFDHVFAADGIRVIRTPVRAPKANAYAERLVRTARTKCLDWLLICNRRHLERVLALQREEHDDLGADRDQRRAGRELGCLAADSADGAGNVIVTGAPKSRGLSFAGSATTGRPRPTDAQTAAITEATRSADHPR